VTHFVRGKVRPAFLTADLLIGMSIVAVLAVLLFVMLGRASRLASKGSDTRASARVAESALADLQAERAVSTPTGATIDIRAEPGGAVVRSYTWVRVSAAVADESAELVGLVPDGPRLRQALTGSTTAPATREGQ
jgi:hypothetical protein